MVVVGPDGTGPELVVALGLAAGEVREGRTFVLAETVQPDAEHGDRLVASAVAAVLRALAPRRLPVVEFEGPHIDPHIGVMTSVPAVAADPLTILVSPG